MPSQRLMSFGVFLLVVVLGATTLLGQSRAQTGNIQPVYTGSDRGILKVYSSGQLVGEENFQIVADGSNFKASSETRLTLERINTKVTFNLKSALQFTKNFEPLTYQVTQEAGGNTSRAQVKFKPGASDVQYENDTRTIELEKNVAVLDNNVYHHYILLARRYDFEKGGDQEFSAFVPQEFLSGSVSLADNKMENTLINGTATQLQHLVVDTGDLQIHLWLDANHVVRKISVPQSNVDVIRQ